MTVLEPKMGRKWTKNQFSQKKKRQNLDFQSRKWAQNANFSNKKNATWSFEMSNFNGKQQQKFKYYVSTSQPDQI